MARIAGSGQSARLLLIGVFFVRGLAQLPPDAQAAADTWLLKSCSQGEQDQLTDVLRKYKTQFETFFLNALQSGPPSALVSQVEAAASKAFDLRRQALKTGNGLGLSPAQLDAARKVTREQYVAGERDNFIISYKSRAVGGLGIVAGERGRAALRALAADGASPLQGSAQQALLQLQSGPPRK